MNTRGVAAAISRQKAQQPKPVLERQLFNLNIVRNFVSFVWKGDILAGEEKLVRVIPQAGKMPDSFLVLNGKGTRDISQGDTAWTPTLVSLKNNSAQNFIDGRVVILFGSLEGV